MKVKLFHPILWSKYKAAVFSEMYRVAPEVGLDVSFVQMAETDTDRASLSGVDLSRHRYPYNLLFAGKYSRISTLRMSLKSFWTVLRSDADLILLPGFSERAHWSMLLASVISGKRRAVFCDSTIRDRPQSILKGLFKRMFFALCDGYFTYGQRGREYLEHYGARSQSVHRRCQAAALPDNYSVDRVIEQKSEDATVGARPVFLYVGRLAAEKSVDVLLNALALLHATVPGARLRIVGEGPMRGELERQRISLGLSEAVDFVGALDIDALSNEYASAFCFVLPSQSEPWGIVVNEALHFGCPVIVSDNCGCVPELVADGVNGYSFPTGSSIQLCARMNDAIHTLVDRTETARRCLDTIAPYSAETSARQTLAGCVAIIGQR